MRIICNTDHDIKSFHHNKAKKTLAAEASSLRAQLYSQIYEDAADVGLTITNRKTGRTAVFYLRNVVRDVSNDITSWEFIPTNETIRRYYKIQGYVVVVYND